MGGEEIVRAFIAALESGNTKFAAMCMSEDFSFSGCRPHPTDKRAFLTMYTACYYALPDFSFNLGSVREVRGGYTATFRITGSHVDTLALPYFGVAPAMPTGTKVVLPLETVRFRLDKGLITGLEVAPVEGGGFAGIFAQVGLVLKPVIAV